jgi:hypothetical protein
MLKLKQKKSSQLGSFIFLPTAHSGTQLAELIATYGIIVKQGNVEIFVQRSLVV